MATLLFGTALGAAVGLGEALRAWGGWRPEASRRLVHFLTGVLVALCPFWFAMPWGGYALAALFVGVNLWAVPRRVFPGMHAIARPSWGTVTFPLALLFALATCWTLDPSRTYILQVAFLVLAVADPLASLVGTALRRPGRFVIAGHTSPPAGIRTEAKSVAGSAAFFLSAWIVTASALMALGGHGLGDAALVFAAFTAAALATGAELLARRGWDNFFIVVAVVTVLAWLHVHPDQAIRLAVFAAVAAAFGGGAYAVRFLDLGGAVAAAGLAFSVLVLGAAWAVPGAAFFVLSSLLSRVGRRRKAQAEALAAKGSRRDAGQVYANGGVAWALLVTHVFLPSDLLYWAYAGAFAAAAADTWGTEVGTLLRGATRLVWSGRRVPPGTSGGVSLAGTLGALAGAGVVFASLSPFAGPYLDGLTLVEAALLVVGGGFAASLVDSLAGATVQALWRDPATGALSERPAGTLARGRAWVTNDRVNLIGTLTGALVPLAMLALR